MPNDTYENYGYPSAFAFRGRLGQPFQADEYNGMLVSDNLPQGTRICQSGRVYCISTAAGTAKAPVGTVGTTTAAFALWNGNAVTTKYCMVVTEVEARLVSGTAPVGSTMTLGLSSAVQGSAVSGYSGVVGPKSLSNSTGRTSQAVIGGAITLAGAPVWRGVASTTVAPPARRPGPGRLGHVAAVGLDVHLRRDRTRPRLVPDLTPGAAQDPSRPFPYGGTDARPQDRLLDLRRGPEEAARRAHRQGDPGAPASPRPHGGDVRRGRQAPRPREDGRRRRGRGEQAALRVPEEAAQERGGRLGAQRAAGPDRQRHPQHAHRGVVSPMTTATDAPPVEIKEFLERDAPPNTLERFRS